MLLGCFYFVTFASPIRFQSYRCLSSCCLLTFSGYFHVRLIYIKCSAILRFFRCSRGGGGVMLNLVYDSMFLLRELCSALCLECYG